MTSARDAGRHDSGGGGPAAQVKAPSLLALNQADSPAMTWARFRRR